MTSLIGVTGLAGHGKDTLASYILQERPTLKSYAFAAPIKELVHSTFTAPTSPDTREGKELSQGFTVNYWNLFDYVTAGPLAPYIEPFIALPDAVVSLEDVLEKVLPNTEAGFDNMLFQTSYRELYQLVGTEWGRQSIDLDFWINMAPTENHVITDVRGQGDHPFNKNTEAEFILNNGGVVVEVVNPRLTKEQCKAHSSEAGIDPSYITHTIINDGDLKDLQGKVTSFLSSYNIQDT